MQRIKRQSGVSMLGVLMILGLFSFFLTVMLRLVPTWMDGRSVAAALDGVVQNSNPDMSLGEVNKKVTNSFTTNQIDSLNPRDVKVYRDKGKIVIDARYEKRTKLFEGIDAVLMFEDLIYTIE